MALNDFENFISPLIEQQFPSVYRDDGPEFVAFAIKIVGQSNNTCVVPLVSALRCIALT